MAIVQISKIIHRSGANTDLPQLDTAEIGFASDTRQVFIGNDPLQYPPDTNSTTQTEILTEYSALSFAKLAGTANTSVNITGLHNGQLFVYESISGTWINAGGSKGGVINLGDSANVKVTGGVNGSVLQTDGTGNLTWTQAVSGVTIPGTPKGSNSQLQFNDAGDFGGSGNLTYNKVTNVLTLSGNLTAGNVNSNTHGSHNGIIGDVTPNLATFSGVVVNTNANIVETLTAGNVNINNQLTVASTSILGDDATIKGQLYINWLNSSTGLPQVGPGLLPSVANIYDIGSNASQFRKLYVNSANISTSLNANQIISNSMIVTGNAIINGHLTVHGNTTIVNATSISISDLNIKVANGATSASSVDGAGLIVDGANANLTYVYAGDNWNFNKSLDVTGNITVVNLLTSGNITSVNADLGNTAIANYFIGSGNNLSNIQSANITGVVANSTHSIIADTANLIVGSNVSGYVANATHATIANVANVAYSITGSNVTSQVANALVASTVYTNAQPNITSVGTLTSLAVTGNTTTDNLTGANLVSANYFTGTLTTNSQPNITSVGTLTSLIVNANISGGNANLGNAVTANYFSGTLDLLSNSQPNITSVGTLTNLTTANATLGNLATANYFSGTFDELSNSQPNITSVGTLTNLTTANANLGNLATANYFSGTFDELSNSQPNITTLGTLVNVDITSNAFVSNRPIATFANSAPTTSVGDGGDVPGLVYATGDFLYICYGTYDGVTDIWSKTATVGNTWIG